MRALNLQSSAGREDKMDLRQSCCASVLTFACSVLSPTFVHPQTPSRHVERDNKEVVTEYIDGLWNQLRYDLIDQVLSPTVVAHASDGTNERGSQRFHQVIPAVRSAFPDLHLTIEEMLAEGDRVAVRLRINGTHEGDFADLAPTHRRIDVQEWFFFRLADSRIVEYWYLRDQEGLLRQLRASE
jgi:predicted ester cyclase